MLLHYEPLLSDWFGRIVLQTPADMAPTPTDAYHETTTADTFTTTVLYATGAQGGERDGGVRAGRTLRVIRQGCRLGELLKLSHRVGMATGDSSLAEALSAGKVTLYDAMPHKQVREGRSLPPPQSLQLPPPPPFPNPTTQDTLASLGTLCRDLGLSKLLQFLHATRTHPYPGPHPISNITMNLPAAELLGCGTDDMLSLARLLAEAHDEAQALSDHVAAHLDLAPAKLAKLCR